MEMREAPRFIMCALAVVALAGCSRVSKDHSKVVANVGGEKITENEFRTAMVTLYGDEAKVKELMANPAMRNQALGEFVDQRTLIKYGDKQGLAKDAKVKLLMEGAKANAYGQVLMDRTIPKGEPTEAQLKAFYDEAFNRAKAAGQEAAFPPYETVKAQLPGAYKQKQVQEASLRLLKDAKAQVSRTVDPEWKAAGQD
jgi:hypothetical protein